MFCLLSTAPPSVSVLLTLCCFTSVWDGSLVFWESIDSSLLLFLEDAFLFDFCFGGDGAFLTGFGLVAGGELALVA